MTDPTIDEDAWREEHSSDESDGHTEFRLCVPDHNPSHTSLNLETFPTRAALMAKANIAGEGGRDIYMSSENSPQHWLVGQEAFGLRNNSTYDYGKVMPAIAARFGGFKAVQDGTGGYIAATVTATRTY